MIRLKSRGRRAARVLILGISLGALGACDSLLEVDLPHLLTDAAIEGEGTAELQVMSAIALFECGYTAFGLMGMGAEDTMESIAGVYGGGHVYDETPDTGACDPSSTGDSWFDQIMGTRALLSTAPGRLVPTALGVGRGVYDRIQDEWSLGSAGERLSAISAIYMAASLTHMGEFLCEIAIDGSDIHSPADILALAETWIGLANGHIGTTGDFAMPNGIASSAQRMTDALSARINWAQRDFAQAGIDAGNALAGDPTFTAWVTREAGETRRNKIWHNATEVGFSAMQGRVDWWNPAIRLPNGAAAGAYAGIFPDPIPFTGYLFLGIGPEGETLQTLTWDNASNLSLAPVVYAEEVRDATTGDPVPIVGFTGTQDTRVTHHQQPIQGPVPEDVPDKYIGLDDDIAYMSWQELRLIQAKNELENGTLAAAIGHINALRSAAGLQQIVGAYLTSLDTQEEVRFVLHEERKREFFAGGARYWSTKIQNADISWFPRSQGETPFQGYAYLGAVRQLMAGGEYEANPEWINAGGLAVRTTGCQSIAQGGWPGGGLQAPRLRI